LKKLIAFALCVCSATFNVQATEDLYSIVSVGYGRTEFNNDSTNDLSYKLGLGWQVDKQWYIEVGMQKFADEPLPDIDIINPQEDSLNIDASALFVAALGKASGNMGELFYRIGVLKTDIKGRQLIAANSSCDLGTTLNPPGAAYSVCDYDKGGIAGVIGLGFDFFIGTKSMLRAEIEYIKGQNDLVVSAAYLGFRYNF
jgi:hypothetical protein